MSIHGQSHTLNQLYVTGKDVIDWRVAEGSGSNAQDAHDDLAAAQAELDVAAAHAREAAEAANRAGQEEEAAELTERLAHEEAAASSALAEVQTQVNSPRSLLCSPSQYTASTDRP